MDSVFWGRGVRFKSVERAFNNFLTQQVQQYTSTQNKYQVFVDFTSRIDELFANSSTSLNTSMHNFFSAMQDISASPSTLPERQSFLGEANNMVDRFQIYQKQLQDLNGQVNSTLRTSIDEINSYSDQLGILNREIVAAISSSGGASPNDLLDQRDLLIQEIAKKVSVNAVEQDNGAINLFVGNGQPLVVGSQVSHMAVVANPLDSSSLEVTIASQANNIPLTNFFSGGEIEGLVDFRNKVLRPAMDELGLLALNVTENFNNQHQGWYGPKW